MQVGLYIFRLFKPLKYGEKDESGKHTAPGKRSAITTQPNPGAEHQQIKLI